MNEAELRKMHHNMIGYLRDHLDQLERDYHAEAVPTHCVGTHRAMRDALDNQIVEIKHMLRDLNRIELVYHEPQR